MENILHIHAQSKWHDDAWIVGNEAGLKALRDAIDKALSKKLASCEAYVGDGEGFTALVIWNESIDEHNAVPYTDEMAAEAIEEAKWPRDLLSSEEYKLLLGES